MTPERPRLALFAVPGVDDDVRALLTALSDEVDLITPDPQRDDPFFATDVRAVDQHATKGLRGAVWVESPEMIRALADNVVVATASQVVAHECEESGRAVIVFHRPVTRSVARTPWWPLVRSRRRMGAGFGDELLIVAPADGSVAVSLREGTFTVGADDPNLDDLLRQAPAVVCIASATVTQRAEAYGAICLETPTDPTDEDIAALRTIIQDPAQASAYTVEAVTRSRAADVAQGARTLLELLGLHRDLTSLQDYLVRRLDLDHLDPTGPIAARIEAAFAGFPAQVDDDATSSTIGAMTQPPTGSGFVAAGKAYLRGLSSKVLDRIAARVADNLRDSLTITRSELDETRALLDRTRRDLETELTILRSELTGRDQSTPTTKAQRPRVE